MDGHGNEAPLAVIDPNQEHTAARPRILIGSLPALIASYSAAVTLLLYATGFVVAGTFLQTAGVPLSAVGHTEYLAAGLLFVSCHALFAFPVLVFRLGSALSYVVWLVIAGTLAVVMYILDAPALLVVAYSSSCVVISGAVRDYLLGTRTWQVLAQALLMIALCVAFGRILYPAIPASLGGGQPRPVEIRLTEAFTKDLDERTRNILTRPVTDTRVRELFEIYSGRDRVYLAAETIEVDLKPRRPAAPIGAVKKVLYRLAAPTMGDLSAVTFISIPLNAIAVTQHLPRWVPGVDRPVHVTGPTYAEELRASIVSTRSGDGDIGRQIPSTEALARKPQSEWSTSGWRITRWGMGPGDLRDAIAAATGSTPTMYRSESRRYVFYTWPSATTVAGESVKALFIFSGDTLLGVALEPEFEPKTPQAFKWQWIEKVRSTLDTKYGKPAEDNFEATREAVLRGAEVQARWSHDGKSVTLEAWRSAVGSVDAHVIVIHEDTARRFCGACSDTSPKDSDADAL